MVTRTLNPKTRRRSGTNGYQTNPHWPVDFAAAYERDRGPYTLHNAITLLAEEPLELINGWLVWQSMTDAEERRAAANIQEILSLAARAIGFGQAYPDQLECEMANEDVYKPDVCLISKERYDNQVQPAEPGSQHFVLKGSPELVVEIRSPSNRRTRERQKRANYFENGALVIWDVDYKKRRIWVYEVGTPDEGREYHEQDVITCEAILPGWKRKVADFFSKDLSAEEIVGEAANQWRAESRAEGRAEGELAVLRRVLLIQAQARFGNDLPDDLEERLSRYEQAELMNLAASLPAAHNLAEWLKA